MYRRKRNLKDLLCKSDISSTSVPKESFVCNQPCNHGKCKLCPSFVKSNTILNSKNDRKMKIERGGSCNTSNIILIYAAECRKHKKLYIGQSKNQVNRRFCGHRSDIKKLISNTSGGDIGETELSEQFSSSPHSPEDLRVRILDNNPKWRDIDQLTMEDYYICTLKYIEPDGLNVRHGTFAKFYYDQF